ncbi:MAG: PAS domain S-box protein [Piscinibacter sp.]|nr:PAS domain S-box protein [Piscinibacter sp.]
MAGPPQLFESLFAAYPDALLVVDGAGGIVLANPAAAALLGYTVEALQGLSVDSLVPDAIRPRHAAWRHAYASSPRARPMGSQMELVARRGDGSEVMVEIALSPLQDRGLPYVVAAIRGIGAYPRVRQALQRARYSEHVAQFGRLAVDARDPQLLIEAAPQLAAEALEIESVVLLLLDPNRQESRVAAGFGLGPDEQPGTGWPPGDPPPTGPGWASALAVPLSDRGQPLGTLLLRSNAPQRFGTDERRFAELLCNLLATGVQRARSEEALSHAQRLESVGQLTGGIAHDFNNLLTVISGNLQVLEELPALAQDGIGPQLVAAAARASRRGAELTGKLLAFSRRQVLQPAALDLGALLEALADMLRRTLDQRVAITVQVEPGCPAVLADPGQLESALLNIAINARDAMPDGGTLAFACRALPAHDPGLPLELAGGPGEGHAGYVEIDVADSGAGMPEAVKERAFEPFFTTKDAGRGTGLGLSTVYGFVRQSHGAVRIDSAPGAGTTLRLFLPAIAGDGDAAAGAQAETSLPPGLPVMLVEDDPEVRQVVQRFLDALGCRVSAYASGEDALAALADAEVGVLLTDIALGPGLRGTELAEQARALRPGLPVLLMSGYSSALLDAPPGWPLLRKPYSRAELALALARLIGTR